MGEYGKPCSGRPWLVVSAEHTLEEEERTDLTEGAQGGTGRPHNTTHTWNQGQKQLADDRETLVPPATPSFYTVVQGRGLGPLTSLGPLCLRPAFPALSRPLW